MWCVIPQALYLEINLCFSQLQKETYLHLLLTLSARVIYVYVQIHHIPKNTKFAYILILSNIPVIATELSSIHELWFYHVVRGTMGPEVQHLPSSTECRGNKDIFTSLSSYYFHIHPCTRFPSWKSFAQISGSKSYIWGIFLSERQKILLIGRGIP